MKKKIEILNQFQRKSIEGINNKLFDNKLGSYVYYDLRNKEKISLISSSSFSPLFCGAPDKSLSKN